MNIIDIAKHHGVNVQVRAGQVLLQDVEYSLTTGKTIQSWVNATTWTVGKLLTWLGK